MEESDREKMVIVISESKESWGNQEKPSFGPKNSSYFRTLSPTLPTIPSVFTIDNRPSKEGESVVEGGEIPL